MKKTAVSWLVEQIDNPHTLYWLREVINQAIEMEKEQHKETAIHLFPTSLKKVDFEQYYNETFTEK